MKTALFRLIFPRIARHMEHLVADVIRLERENARLRALAVPSQGSTSSVNLDDVATIYDNPDANVHYESDFKM